MSTKTSLEHKTIRPGSLSDYSFYYSNRSAGTEEGVRSRSVPRLNPGKIFVILAVLAAAYFGYHLSQGGRSSNQTPAAASVTTPCSANNLQQFIAVSISKRHLWACDGSKVLYSSAVVTGMMQHASTATPTGTYKIYGKQQNTVLTGSDETGSWRDPVSYWMPFLSNQYGVYGFHDATWRSGDQFGNVDPNSDKASHGCVELPLNTAAWLYNWAQVGTELTISA